MLIDISRDLYARIAVWPGDQPFRLTPVMQMAKGDSVNVTTVTMSAHCGTHADAPYHFSESGLTIDQLDLATYWGVAQVVTLDKPEGPLFPADFDEIDLTLAPRLLIHTAASTQDPTRFHTDFIYPTPELAAYLAEQGVILWGTDAPSVDAADSKTMLGHHALHQHDIAILEGLDLSQAADGLYELVALPLKLRGGDGSPVRAVLKPIDNP